MADPNVPDQLQLAWNSTWNGEMNGSMMLSYIYKCFDARLFAIHPETHLIRVFVDYDIINEFHGKRANLLRLVLRAVLQLRWDLAILENSPGMIFPFLSRFTNIPELLRPKARKLTYGDPSKEGSSTQGRNTQASGTQASGTQASGT
ncbi:hypothetical protein VM1G_08679 [Cytospora mali]|uniref:Uncharacterized protein n=1 Tax=Cytospora mali TaxID=578113 RepID=A0A194WAI2_CYTMA|nr:hypothetical protein VM1G_08679 [Valsa mali]